MNSPNQDDHWRSLVEEIGAEPSEKVLDQSEDSVEAEPAAPPEPVMPPTARKAKPQPTRRPSDWRGLASELGLEVPEIEQPIVESADRSASDEVEPVAEDDESLNPDSDRSPDNSAVDNIGWSAAEPSESSESGIAFFEPDVDQEFDTVNFESVESDDDGFGAGVLHDAAPERVQQMPVADDLELDEGELDEGESELPRSSGKETDERPTTRRRRRRGRRRTKSDEAPQEDGRAPAQRKPAETDPAAEVDTAADQQEADDNQDGGESPPSDGTDGATTKTRSPRRRRRKPTRRPKQTDDAENDDDAAEGTDDDSDEAGSTLTKSGDRAKHRKIPTWEETISVIVDANMESRGKGNTAKTNSRGGGRRRGRGSGKRS